MKHTVIAVATRPDSRPNRLARRLALDKTAGDCKLVVLDLVGDDALAERLRPYPHLDWAVVRPDPDGVELASVRPADRWTFLSADAVPLTSLEDLLVGSFAAVSARRWSFTTLLTANDDGSNLGPSDWISAAECSHQVWSRDDAEWRKPPDIDRTICLAAARILVCGPDAKTHLARPDNRVKLVAEARS